MECGIIPSNRLEVFISYETTTGQSYASNLKKAIEKTRIAAFVANDDIQKGAPDMETIDNAIRDCTYFVVIMTIPAILSDEVEREVKLATDFKKQIIPCKPQTVDRALTNVLPLVGSLQQIDFESKEHLADLVVTEIVKRKRQDVIRLSTGRGATQAAATELANIQSAVISMMVDNNLTRLPNPMATPTSDMGAFPDAISVCGIDKIQDPKGNPYRAGDKNGFILYQHDIIGDGRANVNLVNYVVQRYTKGTYTVDAQGSVTQVTTGY